MTPTEQRAQNHIDEYPVVTIIMPIRNEVAFIERSLGAVLAQDYAPDHLEILVADGMSDDGTREIVRRVAAEQPRVRLVDNPGRIVPMALNAALCEARGEIIQEPTPREDATPDWDSDDEEPPDPSTSAFAAKTRALSSCVS